MDCFTFMCLLCLSITLKKIIWWFERLLRVGCQSPCIVCTSVKGKEGSEKKNSQVKLTKQISNQFNKKLWAHTLYTKVERCSAKFVINVSFLSLYCWWKSKSKFATWKFWNILDKVSDVKGQTQNASDWTHMVSGLFWSTPCCLFWSRWKIETTTQTCVKK